MKICLGVGGAHEAAPNHRGALGNRFMAGETLDHGCPFCGRQPSAVRLRPSAISRQPSAQLLLKRWRNRQLNPTKFLIDA
jgi:hypothetical protein